MAFADRFVQLPIKVYDTKQAELIGKPDYEDGWMKILPFEISNYKPMIDDDNGDVECVSVRLKNGDSFYAYLTVAEFESLLDTHSQG